MSETPPKATNKVLPYQEILLDCRGTNCFDCYLHYSLLRNELQLGEWDSGPACWRSPQFLSRCHPLLGDSRLVVGNINIYSCQQSHLQLGACVISNPDCVGTKLFVSSERL